MNMVVHTQNWMVEEWAVGFSWCRTRQLQMSECELAPSMLFCRMPKNVCLFSTPFSFSADSVGVCCESSPLSSLPVCSTIALEIHAIEWYTRSDNGGGGDDDENNEASGGDGNGDSQPTLFWAHSKQA